jgi:GAF domain-containing protein
VSACDPTILDPRCLSNGLHLSSLTVVTTKGHISHLAPSLRPSHNSCEMLEMEQLSILDSPDSTPESICTQVARIFGVRTTEIALLRLTGKLLKFVYPPELKHVGAIPLSSSAVAAVTARKRRPDLFNTFTRVKHSSVFEVVKLGETGADAEVIQKLMSVPIIAESGEVVGVIQVSQKAYSPATTGPDFTSEDLHKLQTVAASIARVMDTMEP